MSAITMMDYIYSRPNGGTERAETSMVCESEGNCCEELEPNQRLTISSTALARRSMASGYNATEMEGALRVMTHAGRILWRAAMEAIPGSAGSYNPPLRVLSKLFQKSFGIQSKPSKENDSVRNILPFSFGRKKAEVQDESHAFVLDQSCDEEEARDYAMEIIPNTTSDLSDSEDHDEIQSQPKKRKTTFGISSLLPSVVSDSEEEKEEECESLRPRKRVRRSFDTKPMVPLW